jgi:hypothetical protein
LLNTTKKAFKISSYVVLASEISGPFGAVAEKLLAGLASFKSSVDAAANDCIMRPLAAQAARRFGQMVALPAL